MSDTSDGSSDYDAADGVEDFLMSTAPVRKAGKPAPKHAAGLGKKPRAASTSSSSSSSDSSDGSGSELSGSDLEAVDMLADSEEEAPKPPKAPKAGSGAASGPAGTASGAGSVVSTAMATVGSTMVPGASFPGGAGDHADAALLDLETRDWVVMLRQVFEAAHFTAAQLEVRDMYL